MRSLLIGFGVAALTAATPALAQQWYVGAGVGVNATSDSQNSGSTGSFSTGNGEPAIPFGTEIVAGTDYGWDTDFESGLVLSGEFGARYASGFRSGLQIAYSNSDVSKHSGVSVGSAGIDGVDAAVLTGSADQLGVTVGQVVANGRGELSNFGVFANVYYDFNRGRTIEPYIGAGIGFSVVDVQYNPSGISVIDDSRTKFAYQLKAGASVRFSDSLQFFGEYAYRGSSNPSFDNKLFPGTLEIENDQNVFLVGARVLLGNS